MKDTVLFLEYIAYQIRFWSLRMTTKAQSGHPTSALSAADIVAVLFFHTMQYDPHNYENPDNDRFILSKGHAAPVLYIAWHELGLVSEKELLGYRTFRSNLEGHPTLRFPYAEAATGSLGIGLSIGLGEALNAMLDKRAYKTFVLLGDSEVSEGSVWEAVQLGAYYKAHNLIGIIDCNRLGQSTATMEALEGDEAKRFEKMFSAFGWCTYVVDGHSISELVAVFDEARTEKNKPVMIIARTKKGYGVDLFEDKEGFHGKVLDAKQCEIALEQLKKRFPAAAAYTNSKTWKPKIPAKTHAAKISSPKQADCSYIQGQSMATRQAFGQALATLGDTNQQIVSLDAEVKNSTYAELFEKKHPQRFFQCFIAEQNMVSMGVGFERRGKIPFISTFAAFITRAHDQIRMAAIGTSALRIVGSHAGVSIGQDGPSQMGLEDISMMRTIPNSVVLYPCDAVSAYKLVGCMIGYTQGISYLRTTRMETPIRYAHDEEFTIGGSKILKQSKKDVACIVAAGVTVVEALKAYELLAQENTYISVIDAYSIKPLDAQTIAAVTHASGKRIITVEDHYRQGGLGSAVVDALCNEGFTIKRLAVDELSRSGTPQELLHNARIDSAAIIAQVRAIVS